MLDKIEGQNVALDYLHYDLQDILEQQDTIKNEWVVERDEAATPYRALVMPWTRGCQEDERFRRSLRRALVRNGSTRSRWMSRNGKLQCTPSAVSELIFFI